MADDIQVQIKAQIDNLVSGLNGATDALTESFKKLESQIAGLSDGIEKKLGAAAQNTSENVKKLHSEVQGVGEAAESIKSKISAAFEFVGVALAVELVKKLSEAMHQAAERAQEIVDTSVAFGITTRELQGLEAIAAKTGGTSENLRRGMLIVQQQMLAAADGSADAAIKLERVGISLADIRDPAFTAADALVRMGESGATNAEIMAVVGVRNHKLLEVVRELKDGWNASAEAGEKVNALSRRQIDVLDEYKKKTAILDLQWQNFTGTLAASVAEGLNPVLDKMISINEEIGKSPKILAAADAAWRALKAGVALAASQIPLVGGLVNIVPGAPAGRGGLGGGGHGPLRAPAEKRPEPDKGTRGSGDATDELHDQSASGSIDLRNAKEIAKNQITIAEEVAAQRHNLALSEVAQQQSILEQRFSLGEISARELVQQETQLVDDKLAAEVQYYEDLKALYADDSNEVEKLNTKIIKADQDANVQRVAIQTQGVRKIQQQWTQMMRPVVDAFSQGIDAMIHRALSLSQAVHSVLNAMLTNVIRTTTQAVARWLVAEHAKTSATVAGEAARTAATEEGHKKGLLASAGSALKEIFIAAYTAAANVYKSVSAIPYVGWILAPIAAAATFAVVAGYAASVSSAKGGMWEVPGDQMAQIHKKESILPANIAEPMRAFFSGQGGGASGGGGGGGGDHYNFTVRAIDAKGVEQFFKKHGRGIAESLRVQRVRNNPTLRPAT
jgi:hypothetical protein